MFIDSLVCPPCCSEYCSEFSSEFCSKLFSQGFSNYTFYGAAWRQEACSLILLLCPPCCSELCSEFCSEFCSELCSQGFSNYTFYWASWRQEACSLILLCARLVAQNYAQNCLAAAVSHERPFLSQARLASSPPRRLLYTHMHFVKPKGKGTPSKQRAERSRRPKCRKLREARTDADTRGFAERSDLNLSPPRRAWVKTPAQARQSTKLLLMLPMQIRPRSEYVCMHVCMYENRIWKLPAC